MSKCCIIKSLLHTSMYAYKKKNQTYLLYHTQTRTVRITDACMSLCLCASLALLCTISRFMCRQFETQGIVLVLTFFPWKPKNALHQPCFFSTDCRPLMKCKDRHLKPPKRPKAVPHTCCCYDVIFNSQYMNFFCPQANQLQQLISEPPSHPII